MYLGKEYWDGVARAYGWSDDNGFSAVLHPDAPAWFNAMIDRLQEKAWRWGLQHCHLVEQSRVLDVGCGTGRWLRRYQQDKVQPFGLDATHDMVRRAADGGLICPLVVSHAQRLPFLAGAFELVSAVTVIQHIPPADQRDAIREMARVLRPGGHVLLLDLIRGKGPHIFPQRPEAWIDEARSTGLSLVSWTGQEYLFLDRAFVWVAQTVRTLTGHASAPTLPARACRSGETDRRKVAGKTLYWAMRRVTCMLSEWLEPLARRVCPRGWATHGLFVFRRDIDPTPEKLGSSR